MSVNAPTVLVTGANGYLSCHVINELLRKGYHVRGTVRSKAAECVVSDTFPEAFGSKLKVGYVRDLTNPKEFKEPLTEDIIGVVHAASPAPSQVEDNVRDMLDPAVKGATSILEACKLYAGPSLKRVIHISSFAACLDLSKGFRPGYTYSESDWNPTTFEQATTIEDPVALYIASKALSERAVWSWMVEQRPPFDLASLAPVTVFGPHLEQVSSMDAIKSTARLLWHLMDAEKIPEPDFPGCVDVRDTAAMVVAALETPEAGGNRFVLSQQFDWQTAADYARNGLGDARDRIPEGKPGTGKDEGLLTMYQINGSKAVDVLKVDYRPLSVTITDTLSQFLAVEKAFTE
jgi:nucleoside-diphosphate-sugar epimerase